MHIAVCIPTYRRPVMLAKCVEALQQQVSKGFSYSILVVDNDVGQSARKLMQEWQRRSLVELYYDVEPVQNISLARNRVIANGKGDIIAFIDDDEYPGPTWLISLFNTYTKYRVDGVLGPVIPSYEGLPPRWIVRSGLCVRRSFKTGTILRNPKYMRTGNVLLGRQIFKAGETPFDPQFGLSGGEDTDFFSRMVRAGGSFVWCDEAIVYEEVPKQRQKRIYYIRSAFVRGVAAAGRESILSMGTARSIAAAIAYTISLPVLLVIGHHLFMKFLVKSCDHVAKLLAHCGIRLYQSRAH
jgi:succinoglycan biosynthesis protein ExoM